MADGIVPFTSYFPAESLLDAKLKGEQMRNMQAQRGLAERQFQAQEAQAREAAKLKQLEASSKLLDGLYENWERAKDKDAYMKYIRSNPDIVQAASFLVDLPNTEFNEQGFSTIYYGPEGQATIDGKPGIIKPGMPVIIQKNGNFLTRPMTIEDKKEIAELKNLETKSSGQPKPTDLLKRISAIEKTKVQLQAGKGFDPITLAMMPDNVKQEIMSAQESGNLDAAMAALDNEKSVLEGMLPKGMIQEKKPVAIEDENIGDRVSSFIQKQLGGM